MFLRQFFQQVLYGLYTTTQLDIEIDKKEKELQALPSAIDGVYESADMFDGLGKVAGGYEEQHKDLLNLFLNKQEKLRTDFEVLKKIRSGRSS